LATESLVLAIGSWPLTLFCLTGIPTAIVAILLGHIALHRATHTPDIKHMKNRAINSLIISYVYVSFAIYFVLSLVISRVSTGISRDNVRLSICLIWQLAEQVIIAATAALVGTLIVQLV